MLRNINYLELSIGSAAASLVVWFLTGNTGVFLTIFGYLLAIAKVWSAEKEIDMIHCDRRFNDIMDKFHNDLQRVQNNCERSSQNN
jgi:hypothetical protein